MYKEILDFWFHKQHQPLWWKKDDVFDALICRNFSTVHDKAIRCELYEWRASAHGRLAEIIVLDQFSRNLHRDSPLAFANDSLALALAQETLTIGADKELNDIERGVFYLPFMHSESRIIHQVALTLYKKNGLQANYYFELKHKTIIDRFGRYPHRNIILGRESTAEELAFLEQPNSSF